MKLQVTTHLKHMKLDWADASYTMCDGGILSDVHLNQIENNIDIAILIS